MVKAGNHTSRWAQLRADIQARTAEARRSAGYTQQQMADLLQIKLDKYKKWENRGKSAMHIEYQEAFCQITRVRLDWLVTGRGQRTIQAAS